MNIGRDMRVEVTARYDDALWPLQVLLLLPIGAAAM